MGKTKNLNGIPHSLTSSYLSTIKYYGKGYMADWLNSISIKTKTYDIRIDILNDKVHPQNCHIKPLIAWNNELREIITKTLLKNGFDENFIIRAELRFEIRSRKLVINNVINCYPELEDVNGKIYNLKQPYSEQAYESPFNPFSIFDLRYYR